MGGLTWIRIRVNGGFLMENAFNSQVSWKGKVVPVIKYHNIKKYGRVEA
jgi:hypothetical protein